MIDFKADIIPFKSIGNVVIGTCISRYLNDIYDNHSMSYKDYPLPNGDNRGLYELDDTLMICILDNGYIISVGCNQNYKGQYNNQLWPGQTMEQVKQRTSTQKIVNGSLIINNQTGLILPLPSPYDELADTLKDIPDELVLNEIYVADYSSW